MNRLLTLVLFVAFYSISAFAQGAANYDNLLGKVKDGNFTIDFKALRFAYAAKVPTDLRAVDPKLHLQIFTLVNEKKFKEAVKIAEDIQKTNFVDMNSHIGAAMAYQGLADAKKAKYHESIYLGLVNSILKGADGNTPATAYHVVSAGEEVVVLNALELKRGTQTVEAIDGHTYHLVNVNDKATNEAQKVYFNIDKLQPSLAAVPKN